MIDPIGQRPTPGARRRRLSRARPFDDATARLRLHASLTRGAFHGLMIAVGLVAAVTVWSGAAERLQVMESRRDAAVDLAADSATDGAGELISLIDDTVSVDVAAPTSVRLQPLLRTVVEGDTIRSIAAEFSVSMSTILASNRLDNPDLIQVGQEIIIPPVDGVIAEVKQGETLGQLAERYGAQVEDVALANALPNDADRGVPFDKILVPGRETAERAIGLARREVSDADSNAVGSVDPSLAARPDIMTYEVQQGDTLGQLATQFGVNIWTILNANSLSDPELIRPGMRLKVLPVNGVEHEVQAGEKLADIAEFYKVDLGPLIDFKSLSDPDSLRVGLRITIPGAERPQPAYSLAGGVGVASVPAPAVTTGSASAATRPTVNVAAVQRTAAQTTLAQAKPQTPAPAAVQARPAAPVQAAAKPQAPVAP